MIKLTPNDRKLLALLLLIAVVLFSVFIIDFFLNIEIFKKSKDEIDISSSWNDAVNKAMNSVKDTRPAMIRKSLNEIFDLMNAGNYDELFELLSEDFRENQFNNDINVFSKFMESYSTENYSPYFTKYERFGDTYMVLVSFVPYSNTDEDIIETKKPKKSDTFFLNYTSESDYTFSILGYVGEKELGTGVQNDDFKVILDKTVLYKTRSEYYFTITNNTDDPISIDGEDIYCVTGVKPRYYKKEVIVPAHFSTNFCFSVGTGLSIATAVPNQICFKNIRVAGKEYSFYIDTAFCLDI